ncbi:hypothetical protein pb186bvf_001464 [Paramecium bursaria]
MSDIAINLMEALTNKDQKHLSALIKEHQSIAEIIQDFPASKVELLFVMLVKKYKTSKLRIQIMKWLTDIMNVRPELLINHKAKIDQLFVQQGQSLELIGKLECIL